MDARRGFRARRRRTVASLDRSTSRRHTLRRRMRRPFFIVARRWMGAGVALACALVAVARAGTAPVPPPARVPSAEERGEMARSLARQEPAWRRAAERLFPGDRWSRDDDFFNQEHRAVRGIAAARGTNPGQVLRAIDEELRAHPDGRKVGASPIKPRPFYD